MVKTPALYLTTSQVREAVTQLEGIRLPQGTLSDWLRYGLVQASIYYDGKRGKAHAAKFNLDDLVRVRFVVRLRRSGRRWSPAAVRDVLADPLLQRALRAKTNLEIVIAGSRVLVQSKHDADMVTAAIQAGLGQYVFRFPAAELLEGNAEAVNRIRRKAAAA